MSAALEDGHLDVREFLRELQGLLAEVTRRADVGRKVAEVAGEIHPVRDRETARRGGFAVGEVRALRYRQRELAQRSADLGLLAFHPVEAVNGFHRDDDRVLDAPGDLAPLHLFLGQIDDGFVGAGLVQELDRGFHRRAELSVAEVALLAEADQQHAIGERPAHVVQEQRRAELALHVAATDDFADITVRRAVDQLRGQRKLAVVEHAHDHACAPLLLGAATFYGKFHRPSLCPPVPFLCRSTASAALLAKRLEKVKNLPLS